MDQKYVWPWCGVIANLPVETDEATGLPVGKSTSGLRNQLNDEGFSARKVTAVWNYAGFFGFALVEFKSDRTGYENAMNFKRSFQLQNLGKRDWAKGTDSSDKRLYGLAAGMEDYHSRSALGKELRKRSPKSFSDFLAEEERKVELLAGSLSDSIKRERKLDEDNEPGKHQRRKF